MGVAAALKRGLRNNSVEAVYIFTGNDGYTKKEYEKKIFKVLKSREPNCERHIFNGRESSVSRIIDEVNGSSLFASEKLVIIKESSSLVKDDAFKDFIKEFSKKAQPECTVIVEYEDQNYSKGQIRGVPKKIQHSFMLPYDNQMPGWVKGKFREMNKQISEEGTQFLIFCCSNNLFNISREIEKIITAFPDKKSYGIKEVKEVTAAHRRDDIFGYLDALTVREEKKALMLLDDLIKYGYNPIYITGMLKWKLQQLITVKKLMDETGLPESKILKKAGLNVYVNRGICSNLKSFSLKKLLDAYDRLCETDIRMKSSGVDNRFLIEEYSIWFMTGS